MLFITLLDKTGPVLWSKTCLPLIFQFRWELYLFLLRVELHKINKYMKLYIVVILKYFISQFCRSHQRRWNYGYKRCNRIWLGYDVFGECVTRGAVTLDDDEVSPAINSHINFVYILMERIGWIYFLYTFPLLYRSHVLIKSLFIQLCQELGLASRDRLK